MKRALYSVWILTLLGLTLPPLWLLLLLAPPRATHGIVQHWARVFLALSGCRPRVAGLHHLGRDGCAVMVANHASFVDSLVLMGTIPGRFQFVANHLAATRPLLGRIIRNSGHLVVDRRSVRSRSACARAMVASLRDRTSLMLFPEGTRATGDALPFKMGAFRAAARTGRPVVPIAILGTGRMLPRRARLLTRGPISVEVLAPIEVRTGGPREATRLRDAAQAAVDGALGASGNGRDVR